jgi:branched-chain amino acid transport system substrate-binding protein
MGSASAQVKFGVGGPITGANAATGAQMKNGVDQAITDINAAGGVLGQKITSEYGDDVSDPKQGVSVANKFAGDGVKFVIGHYNSGVTIPASDVYQENGILEITPSSTNPTITERGMWNIFATINRARSPALISLRISRTRRSPSSTTRPPTAKVSPTKH